MIWDFVKQLPNMIWELLKFGFDNIVKVIQNLFEFVINIPSLIWNLFKTVLDGIVSGISNIVDFFGKFFEVLLKFIKDIFVPSDDYFKSNFNELNSALSSKVGVDIGVLEGLASSSRELKSSPLSPISFNLFGTSLSLDFTFIDRVRNITLALGNGLAVIFLCWYHVKKVIWLIRGSAPVEGNSNIGLLSSGSNTPLLTSQKYLN